MFEVRTELRHTKTVLRQSQDETWSYKTRAKTRQDRNVSGLSQDL